MSHLNEAKRSAFSKSVSLITFFTFLFSISLSPAEASALSANNTAQVESALAKQFAPPSELGQIVDASGDAQPVPSVIHIEDLHANYSVQSNIAKLLEFYDAKLGRGNYKVAVEGAQGPVAMTELGKLTDKNFKMKVCDKLMKEAELTGTEYFAIVDGQPNLLWGVEDQRYHDANIALFQSTYKGKEELAQTLSALEKDLGPIKNKVYSRAMRKIDEKAVAFSKGKMDMAEYAQKLAREASKHGVDVSAQYPEIAKLIGLAPADAYASNDKLFTELADLLTAVQTAQAKTDVQRNVAMMGQELDVLKRLASEELTTQEVRHLAPRLAQVAGRMQTLLDSANVSYDKKNFSETVNASLDFYAIALLRDKYLTENALQLLKDNSAPIKTIVLVTGGFHTPGVTKILKQSGLSYVTVAPVVGSQTDKDKELYVTRLLGQHADPDQLVAGTQMLADRMNSAMAIVGAHYAAAMLNLRYGVQQAQQMLGALPGIKQLSSTRIPDHLNIQSFSRNDLVIGEGGVVAATHGSTLSDVIKQLQAPKLDEAAAKRVTATSIDYNIGHLFGDHTFTLTDDVLNAAREVLEKHKTVGDIKDFLIYGLGQDLHVQINTYGKGIQNPQIHAIGFEAAKAALTTAKQHGLLLPVDGMDFFDLPAQEQVRHLMVRPIELPFTERGAEPIFVSKAIGGGVGFYNQALVNLFFSQKVSNRRLEGAGFFVTVENVAEIRAGKKDRRILFFGDKPEWPEGEIDVVRPNSVTPLHVKASEVKGFDDMSALVGDPTEWVITAVYGAKGRMAQPGVREEPVAVVGVERAFPIDTSIPASPVLMVRQQGGAPAIGESHMASTEFYFGVGGENEGYYTGLLPVTLEQARSMPDTHMVTKVIGYHYQSKKNGEIPAGDIYDQNAADIPETRNLQADAMTIIREAAEIHDMVPFMTTIEAERKMAPIRQRLDNRFTAVPDYKAGEKDPSVEAANTASKGRTLSDIKADVGGKVGHTVVPSYYVPVAEASLEAAKQEGLIEDYKVFYAGDDLHLLMTHKHGIDSEVVHTLAWQTFMRIGWVAYSLEDKWYGLMQDFPNMKGRPVDEDAKLNDAFIALLHSRLPDVQLKSWDELLDAYRNQKPVIGESPFSGNVQGQGPGFAEINITDKGASTFGIFAADKAGPDAFNVPLWYALRKAVEEGQMVTKHGGAKVEVWDIHAAKRALFDLIQERPELQALLAPTHINSAKRVWARNSNQILAALSVEKLGIIADGDYIGKDDPVLIAKPEIIKWFFQFARDHFYMTQGNARGSHNAAPKPRSLKDGIATTNSKPVQVGLMVQVTADNKLIVRDMFDDPSFQAAYKHVDDINRKVWRAQELTGGLVSVPSAQVEAKYPLQTTKRRVLKDAKVYNVGTQDLYEIVAAAHRPIRSLAFAVIFPALALYFLPVSIGVVTALTFTGWFLTRAVAGSFQNYQNGIRGIEVVFAPTARSDKAHLANFLDQGEETVGHTRLLPDFLTGHLPRTSTFNRAWNETAGEFLPNLLSLPATIIGLIVMAFHALANLVRPSEAKMNVSLYRALNLFDTSAAGAMKFVANVPSQVGAMVMKESGVVPGELVKERGTLAEAGAA